LVVFKVLELDEVDELNDFLSPASKEPGVQERERRVPVAPLFRRVVEEIDPRLHEHVAPESAVAEGVLVAAAVGCDELPGFDRAHGGNAARLLGAKYHRAIVAKSAAGFNMFEGRGECFFALGQRVQHNVAGVRYHDELIGMEGGNPITYHALLFAPTVPLLADTQNHDCPTRLNQLVDVVRSALLERVALVENNYGGVNVDVMVLLRRENRFDEGGLGFRRASAIPAVVNPSLKIVYASATREGDGSTTEAGVGVTVKIALKVASGNPISHAPASHPVVLPVPFVVL